MLKTLVLCLFLTAFALAADTTADDASSAPASQAEASNHDVATTIPDKPHPLSGFPSELSFLPTGILGHLVTGGAVAIGVVIIVLIASLFYPFSSVKGLCDLTGSCPPNSNYRVDTYPTPGVLSANTNTQYADSYNSPYSQPGAYSPTYQKRSLEYVGPILKMLNAAYDKYASKAYHPNAIHSSEKSQDKTRRRR
ncbi:hypothetical protein M8J75_014915 [Diaphorina citri]|nr:hypothetical protein M8J75_014915 [Diaphorina citri]